MALLEKKINGKSYFYEVKGYREGNKVRQKILRYFGRHDPRKEPDALPIIKKQITATFSFGDIALLHHCAKSIKLIESVNKYLPKRQGISHGTQLFILAVHRLLANKPSGTNLPTWLESTFLPQILGIDANKINYNTISYTLDSIIGDDIGTDKFLYIAKEIYSNAQKLFGAEEDVMFYDLTSTYFEGKCCSIAKFGYSRDCQPDKLQINIGMTVDKKLGIPLMTKVFEGNIHDTKTVYEMVYYSKYILKKDKVLVIMDRGMDSEDNIRILDTTGYDHIIGLSSKHSFVDELKLSTDISEFEEADIDNKNVKMKGFTKNLYGKRRTVVMYYSNNIATASRESRLYRIGQAEQRLKEANSPTLTKAKEYISGVSNYIDLELQRGIVSWKRNQVQINRAERKDGKFCIITNQNLTASDIYTLYFSKDKVEKGFRCMKQDLDLHPTRRFLPDRVRADVFVCHIGLILLRVAENLLAHKKINIFWDTISSETAGIRVIEYVKSSAKKSYSYVTNNKMQRDIVDALGLEKYVDVT